MGILMIGGGQNVPDLTISPTSARKVALLIASDIRIFVAEERSRVARIRKTVEGDTEMTDVQILDFELESDDGCVDNAAFLDLD